MTTKAIQVYNQFFFGAQLGNVQVQPPFGKNSLKNTEIGKIGILKSLDRKSWAFLIA